jgi:hypothetical protein
MRAEQKREKKRSGRVWIQEIRRTETEVRKQGNRIAKNSERERENRRENVKERKR